MGRWAYIAVSPIAYRYFCSASRSSKFDERYLGHQARLKAHDPYAEKLQRLHKSTVCV